jgi:hypothetical protein
MYEKDGSEKANFCAAKKGKKKPNPAKNSFVQMNEKFEKLEKAIKKQCTKLKKRCRDDSNSNSELGIGLGSIGKIVINLGETIKRLSLLPLVQLKLPQL